MIYNFKTEGRCPKEFRGYQSPIKFFENLRDGDVNLKEVLKNQVKFKSHLSKIKIGSNKLKNKKNRDNGLFRDYSFFLFEAKYKSKYSL